MVNRNYEKGRRFEWEVRDKFKRLGHRVFRMAGSKSEVDLIAIHPINRTIHFVQVKASHLSQHRKWAIKELMQSNLEFMDGEGFRAYCDVICKE